MAAPVMPAFSADKPRTLRLHLRWTMVLVLVALGGAGLAAAADRPANPVQRPELTYRADLAAQPWIDQLRSDLDLVAAEAAQLATDGRDVLGGLTALDTDGANAALGRGDATSARIATLSAELHDTIARAHEEIDLWRLGLTWLAVFEHIDAAITATDELPADWTALADTGRAVLSLGSLGRIADQLLAMEAARGKINDALEAITDAKTGGQAAP